MAPRVRRRRPKRPLVSPGDYLAALYLQRMVLLDAVVEAVKRKDRGAAKRALSALGSHDDAAASAERVRRRILDNPDTLRVVLAAEPEWAHIYSVPWDVSRYPGRKRP